MYGGERISTYFDIVKHQSKVKPHCVRVTGSDRFLNATFSSRMEKKTGTCNGKLHLQSEQAQEQLDTHFCGLYVNTHVAANSVVVITCASLQYFFIILVGRVNYVHILKVYRISSSVFSCHHKKSSWPVQCIPKALSSGGARAA